ncbi:MAG: winged helix DNA-binding protein [Pseudomonadota bacterium]
MDDTRLPPLNGDLRGRDDDELEARHPAEQDGQGFTHRQRAHAKLDPATIHPSAKANARPGRADGDSPKRINSASRLSIAPMTDGATTSAVPRLGLEKPTHDHTAKTTDLRPFADQLVAIAEQLRTGFFDPNSDQDVDQTSRADPSVPHRLSIAPEGPQRGLQAEDTPLTSCDPVQQRRDFAEMARTAYAKRRKRVSIFGDPELFGEPGWDILLDLYIAQAEQKPVSVSSACIGSASPPTTGLRWLGVLADQGLVERKHDPEDQRRVLVRLTDKALEAMDAYFSSSASLQRDRRAAGT